MGGDNTGDATGGQSADAATQAILDQVNARLTQDAAPPQGRANYGGVAPATDNLGTKPQSSDPYYHGGHNGPGRATYGPSGTLAPGGAGDQTNPGAPKVPSFIDAHRGDIRDPNKPYEPNPVGAQAAGGLPGGQAFAPGVAHPYGDDSSGSRIAKAISMRGQYLAPSTLIGAGVGAVTAPYTARAISSGADWLASHSAEGGAVNNGAKWWQNNYDMTKVGKGDLIKSSGAVSTAEADFARMKVAAQTASTSGTDAAAQALAKERFELLSHNITANTTADIKAANAARLEAGGSALFSDAEVAVIDGKYMAGISRAASEKAMIDGLAKAPPGLVKTAWAGIVGMGVDLAAVNIDRSFAKYIGGENSLLHSWNTEQLLAPAALAMGERIVGQSTLGKALLIAGTIGVSRAFDGATQAVGLGAPTALNAPLGVMDWKDGLGVATGLALAASTKNPWAKGAAVLAGWGIPKLIHLAEDNSSTALAGQVDNMANAVTDDHKSRSLGSLESVMNASKGLDGKKEDWVVDKVAQNRNILAKNWTAMPPDQKLLAFRDDAAMSTALGEDFLKKGTRFMKQGKPDYTLGGYEMDLGGRGMQYLIGAKDSTERGIAMTQAIIANNNDSTKPTIKVQGSEPGQSEIDGLNKFNQRIKDDLAKILDQKHDVQAVVDQVAKDIPSSSDDWRQTYILPTDKMIELYAKRNAPAQAAETREVIGKLYRDQAIAYMAYCKDAMARGEDGGKALSLLRDDPAMHNDIFPSGRKKGYNGAEGALAMAIKFDPYSKDLPDLVKMWQATVPQAETLAKKQLTDPNNNILNYGGYAPRPAGQP